MSARRFLVLTALIAVACSEPAPPAQSAAQPSDTPFKLGTFAMNGRDFVGVVLGDTTIIDLAAADAALGTAGDAPTDMKDLITRYNTGVRDMIRTAIGAVEASADAPAYVHDLDTLTVRPPIMYPRTMLNTAVNYADHDIEMARVRDGSPGQTAPTAGGALPDTTSAPGYWERPENDWRWNPYMFIKLPSAVIAHGEPIVIPQGRDQIEWECELGVVMGETASHVPVESALDAVFGYTLENDVSDRGGRGDGRYGSDWLISKSHDTFAPMGPFITPKEFVEDVQNLPITFALNGEVLQEGTTRQMIHSVAEQVNFATNVVTLEVGDVIATGTVPGAGSARTPPIFFKPGDTATCTYGGIGTLVNPVAASQ
jgi:2-keto-4-pentenoate hydratase/2-oxohepta-3-ene-1,7-dioic acid hydratase in catechol pathway